jgi:hypothetical protein
MKNSPSFGLVSRALAVGLLAGLVGTGCQRRGIETDSTAGTVAASAPDTASATPATNVGAAAPGDGVRGAGTTAHGGHGHGGGGAHGGSGAPTNAGQSAAATTLADVAPPSGGVAAAPPPAVAGPARSNEAIMADMIKQAPVLHDRGIDAQILAAAAQQGKAICDIPKSCDAALTCVEGCLVVGKPHPPTPGSPPPAGGGRGFSFTVYHRAEYLQSQIFSALSHCNENYDRCQHLVNGGDCDAKRTACFAEAHARH